ncbi:MAG: acyl-CoA dehydrogenase family protein [Deltaproteobacteria bacterium]|nr:acyl-CoA dehydrogenase family protein [Deltaproteobacteria bacterium]
MDFDFSFAEQALFKDIQDRMKGYAEGKNLEAQDISQVKDALAILGKTPYLKLGLDNPEGFGGTSLMGAMETLATLSPSLYLSVEMSTRLFGSIVATWGNNEQKDRWLTPLMNGQFLGAMALSEECLNVDNDPLKTTGTQDGDFLNITGDKTYVVNGPVADGVAVVGMMNGQLALFIIEQGTSGLATGEPFSTLGYEGAAISRISLNNCLISKDQVIGPFEDRSVLDTLRLWENQILLGASLGLMRAAFESARDYAKIHRSGGKPIIAYQEVAFKLSEMLTLLQTSQLFAYRTAWTLETSLKDAESLMWCAKVFCTEAAEKVSGYSLQILAGSGFISGNPSEVAYRCAKYGQIAGTSTEISRVKIGDAALGYR